MQLILYQHSFMAKRLSEVLVQVLLMQKRQLIVVFRLELVPIEGYLSIRHDGLPIASLKRDSLDLWLHPKDLSKSVAQDAILTMLDIPIDLLCYQASGISYFHFFNRGDGSFGDLSTDKASLSLDCPNLFQKVVAFANDTDVEPQSQASADSG